MAKSNELFTQRKSLDEICTVPEKIISVYSLEKHVWADSNSPDARKGRRPELQTIHEFQIDPVRPFLNDLFRNIAAPYNPERRDNPIGQGYWIQAEFGSGKSHLLSFVAALALGSKQAWDLVAEKEKKANRGKRESLYRFWEEGLEGKSGKGKKGIFVIVKTLVGAGGGTVGLSDEGRRMTEYILDAAKEQLQYELGKNVSLYPVELLADRFLSEDLERFRNDLKKFLRDPKYFEEDEFEDINDFIRDIQQNKTPEYKRSCGNKLWRFYTEYLKVQPHIAAETEEILKYLVDTILAEGYSGVLLVLDEVSLFMKNRSEDQRTDDEKTLVVLSNRLAKIYNLPVWTVCAAQQAIESKMGVKNINADDRLKLVNLLEEDKDYYEIVLARVREIKDPSAIANYYLHYKRGFSWPKSIGEEEFRHFFPFHKPALEVLRAITYELTTARSAIHFMHQTLRHQIKHQGKELIRLWELFDEAIQYEEDPSGVHAGLVAIKTKRAEDYRAYEECKRQIDALTKGYLKVHRDKGVKTIQTLFLYHVARTRQQGLTPEEVANSVLIERDAEANIDENIQHYETLAENLKKELRQIVQTFDEDKKPRYRFDPVFTGVDPRDLFQKARDEAEANELMRQEAWEHLLALDEWPVKTRQMTIDLSNGVKSIFRDIAPFLGPWEDRGSSRHGDQTLEVVWQGRHTAGLVAMRDLVRVASENLPLPPVDSDQTDLDFAVFVSTKSVPPKAIKKLLDQRKDGRVLLWSPGDLTTEEQDRLLDFAAYRKLVSDWQGKETEDAVAVINWVANSLQTDMGRVVKIVDSSYGRGRVDALNNSQMEFHVAGELASIVTPLVDKVLSSAYESRDIQFEPPFIFRKEEGVKVINGIVKTGSIPKGTKPNQNISAAQNFGFGLKVMKKSAERQIDCSDNDHVRDIWQFIDAKLADEGQSMKIETVYKNFMGIGGPKDYGLTRRMVQIFLLCLVREGKLRISVGPKSGLPFPVVDYTNLAGIDFSAKILDSFTEVQKVAKPENWEVLRPYAGKLLGEEISVTHDDAAISGYRSKLLTLFAAEKDEAARLNERAKGLFEALKAQNPYLKELTQVSALLSADVSGTDDINQMLYALKEAMGYQAFDTNAASQTEVDDLANRLRNYLDVKRFVGYETELLTATKYCAEAIPDDETLRPVLREQRKLAKKVAEIQPFVDSEIKLKTELVGKTPPDSGESGTLACLVREYATVYMALHDSVTDRADQARRAIQDILAGDEFRALKVLEKVTALQPAISGQLEEHLTGLDGAVFTCPTPSRSSVEEHLKRNPQHVCGLSFQNANGLIQRASGLMEQAQTLFDTGMNSKVQVFLNPAVQARLQQGKSEKVIGQILAAKDAAGVRTVLVKACLEDASVVDIINRYLKQIVVKRVKLSDFKPSMGTVEKGQIPALAQEFQKFLEKAIAEADKGGDVLPVLQIE
ncbi:hypothetical protein IMZ48_48190 [Candidatus Bathyarchaeota archaeon]|nr:hypothetical protein [Candidatus Bathyarchaeota archaeon]